MHLEDITSSRPVIGLGLMLARVLPPRGGHGLARGIARVIAARRPLIFRTVRENLRCALGPDVRDGQLDELARRVFEHAGMTYYDFFHAVGRPAAELTRLVPLPSKTVNAVRGFSADGRGVLILGMHLSNFDLALLSFGAHGLPVQALSLADPPAGARLLNELRADAGFEVTPITSHSLRQALRRLKRGGIVITACDWPVPEDQALIPFLGQGAYLPQGPARLALMSDAVVFLGACHHAPGEGYAVDVEGPLLMTRTGDRQADIIENTRRFAQFMERQVLRYPEQWMMFRPFWPVEHGA